MRSPARALPRLLCLIPVCLFPGFHLAAQDFPPPPARPEAPAPEPEAPPEEPSRRTYLGREVARTMHWRGAEWLTRDTREKEERTELLLDNLRLEAGQTVGDFGCGNGYLALRMAPRLLPGGRVLAADLQPQMLALLQARMKEQGVPNVEPVLSTATDPGYAPESCDVIVMLDVYHELDRPETVLAAVRRALRPEGRLALVEFRAEDPAVPIKPEHKMSQAQLLQELAYNGFRYESEYRGLPWQHLVFFTKDPRADRARTWRPQRQRRVAANAVARGAARAWLADDGPTLRGFLAPGARGRGAFEGLLGPDFDPRSFGGQGWDLEYAVRVAEPGPGVLRLWCSAPAGDLVGTLREGVPGRWRLHDLGFVPAAGR